MKPLAIDLYCGLGGWTEVLLAEGWRVVGFDVEAHDYGTGRYPGQLVLQDVLTLHGSQFKDASLIVASPPCQEFSYMAMPWSRAKERARKYRAGELDVRDLTRLFDACFRIQREAIEAAGRHIPLIVENVRGAQPWVGRAKWNFGSYYLWGDVPALMPITLKTTKLPPGNGAGAPLWKDRQVSSYGHPAQDQLQYLGLPRDADKKRPSRNFHTYENGLGSSPSFNGASHETRGVKTEGHANIRDGHTHARHLTNQRESDGVKQHGSGAAWFDNGICRESSKSNSRKAASAHIAKIPEPLARHIARVFKPESNLTISLDYGLQLAVE